MKLARIAFALAVVCTTLSGQLQIYSQSQFKRGDSNVDGGFDISDAINTLGFLFLGEPGQILCKDAADANDDGDVDISDALYGLGFLFLGTLAPPAPFGACGLDPTEDNLNCVSFSHCPQIPPEFGITLTTSEQIYAPNFQVSGQIAIMLDEPFSGTLQMVAINNTRAEIGGPPEVFQQSTPLSLSPGQAHSANFAFIAAEEGHITLVLQLISGQQVVEEKVKEIGVRPQISGLPDSMLYAQQRDINVSSVRAQLENAADTDTPVILQGFLTGDIQVVVSRLQLFAAGAQIPPALDGVVHFEGKIVGEPESVVVLTVGDLGQDDMHGMILRRPDDITWIVPHKNYDPLAAPHAHIVYKGMDEIPTQRTDAVETRPEFEGFGGMSHVDTNTQFRDITLQVYEHEVSANRTRTRNAIIADWAGILRNEFRNINPRQTANNCITVNNVLIGNWQSISNSGYGNNCSNNLDKFSSENSGVNNRLYVLFTDKGTDCGGIAYLGQGNSTQWHSITRDVYSHQYNVAVFAQETGHNLDWHTSWNPDPHDPHLDVSEKWDHQHCWTIFCWNHKHCTVMRASYDGCEEAEWRYQRNSDTALRHLAEGIIRYFPGQSAIWGQAFIGTGNSIAETLLDIPNLGGVRDTGNSSLNRTLTIYSNGSVVEYSLQYGTTYTQGEVTFNGTGNITFPHYTSFLLTIYRSNRIGWMFGRENDNTLSVIYAATNGTGGGIATINSAVARTADSNRDTLLDIPGLGGVRDTGDSSLNRTLTLYSNGNVVEYALQHGSTYTQGEVTWGGSVNITFPHYTSFALNIWRYENNGWIFGRENDNTLSAIVGSSIAGCSNAKVGSATAFTTDSTVQTLVNVPVLGGIRDTGNSSLNHTLTIYSNGRVVEYAIQYGGTYSQGEVPVNGTANITFPHYTSFRFNIFRSDRSAWLFCRENDNILTCVYAKSH